MKKTKGRSRKWLAWFIVAALFMGECSFFALAEEEDAVNEVDIVEEEDVADEETDIVEEDVTVDETDIVEGDDADDEADITEEDDSIEEYNADEEVICICESLCREGVVNTDCPVCVKGWINCHSSDFEVDGIRYRVIIGSSGVEVLGHKDGTSVRGSVEIPFKVVDGRDGIEYSVTSIAYRAFYNCTDLTYIKIPKSVTLIEEEAFYKSGLESLTIPDSVTVIDGFAFAECYNLKEVEISNSVTVINDWTFANCTSLVNVKIPDSVYKICNSAFGGCTSLKSIEISDSVWKIDMFAFALCSSLESIKIPSRVTKLERGLFYGCEKLETVEIPDCVRYIDGVEFYDCKQLTKLKVYATGGGGNFSPPYVNNIYLDGVFDGCPTERYLSFVGTDGNELTGEEANAAYKIFDAAEGESQDNLWWGWKLGASYDVEIPVTEITITVNKDGSEWTNHNKTFALKPTGSSDAALITESAFSSVSDGEYDIYDITDTADGVDTGENLTVSGSSGAGVVNYYTVTFYDGDTPYENETPQKQQIVLQGQNVAPPAAPSKEGYRFNGWKTSDRGSVAFDFNAPIMQQSSVYADWTNDAVTEYIIKASAEDGGSISPEGDIPVQANGTQAFEIVPDEGFHIKAVTVDGMNKTAELTDSAGTQVYTFHDVKEDHTIRVSFEADNGGGSESSSVVTITVKKDNEEWANHNKTFALKPTDSADAALITGDSLSSVSDGEYDIYDITDAADGVDTGENLTVSASSGTATVNYYTVTFYDGDTSYGNETPQKQQIVLQGKNAASPAAPSKEGYHFNGWKTSDRGSVAFDFSAPVTQKSSVYADWTRNAVAEYIIKASAEEGGSISPEGDIPVQANGTQAFEIVPDEGFHIKAVTVDGMNKTAELTDSAGTQTTRARAVREQSVVSRYYTFYHVNEDHTIHVSFEADNGGNGGGSESGDNGGNGGGSESGDNGGNG
ncbi:MAG: leucine-rich repeat protein, partial [Clostridium sp.]|nr:leucine-rich repeat protein [Clostridium sp.]